MRLSSIGPVFAQERISLQMAQIDVVGIHEDVEHGPGA